MPAEPGAELSTAISEHGSAARNEIETGVAKILEVSEATQEEAAHMRDIVAAMHEDLASVSATLSQMRANSADVASAIEELQATAGKIGEQADGSTRAIETGVEISSRCLAKANELGSDVNQIGEVLELITAIAGQTNLLALNATIEAARAGEAGKGFAVVASEVKSLSTQTRDAVLRVGALVKSIGESARATTAGVGEIGEVMDLIASSNASVADTVRQQHAANSEIARLAAATASSASSADSAAAEIAARASATLSSAVDVGEQAATTTSTVEEVRRRIMAQGAASEDHSADRYSAHDRATLVWEGRRVESKLRALSTGGALIDGRGLDKMPIGQGLSVHFAELGEIRARVIEKADDAVHLAFIDLKNDTLNALIAVCSGEHGRYHSLVGLAQTTARKLEEAMVTAIKAGRTSIDALFDTSYQAIAGTNPVQFSTTGLSTLDAIVPEHIDAVLGVDPRIVFCAPVDRNAWLPVHNAKFSQKQRPGDVAWNTANSRNRRMFADRAGLAAARNERPFLIQSYMRDMGNDVRILMKEIDVPIRPQGRIWGNLRLAFKSH